MDDAPGRGAPSNVRGWLSEVYLPSLVSNQAEQLVRRLGERATVDDPLFGRAVGMPALARYLGDAATWLTRRASTFEAVAFTTGSDRDVSEGTLTLTADGGRISVPVGIVAERRPEREVELRLYYATRALGEVRAPRAQLVARDDELTVPPPVAAHLQALACADIDGVVESFESGATLRDSAGRTYSKQGTGGALREFYERLFAAVGPRSRVERPAAGASAALEIVKGARADDGRTCALEYTQILPERVTPGLAVYERGENGLLRALRIYEDS